MYENREEYFELEHFVLNSKCLLPSTFPSIVQTLSNAGSFHTEPTLEKFSQLMADTSRVQMGAEALKGNRDYACYVLFEELAAEAKGI